MFTIQVNLYNYVSFLVVLFQYYLNCMGLNHHETFIILQILIYVSITPDF